MTGSTHRLVAVLLATAVVLVAGPLTACTHSPSTIQGEHQTATVLRVISGDTLSVRTQTGQILTVRMIGVRKHIGCWQHHATATTAMLAGPGTTVTLDSDPVLGATDRRGRTLAYIGIPTRHEMLNERLLLEGALREFDYDQQPYRYRDQFIAAQTIAQKAHRGLWNACLPATPS